MAEPFLISSYFVDYILPFILVFTLVFAILQKTQILGDGKKQIDSLVGLVAGLILISFPYSRGLVVLLMPFLAVSIVILLVFMLLYGFAMGKTKGDGTFLHQGWKIAIGAIITVALISYFVYISGYWDNINNFLFGTGSSFFWVNVILIVVIVGAMIAVLLGEKGKSGD
jgi:hypothetical protein